jgi:hypothetical protein
LNGVNIVHRYFPQFTIDRRHQNPNPSKPQTPIHLEVPHLDVPYLEVLGPMRLRVAGTITPLRGGKRKELLALLLEARIRGRSEVTGLDLCDALYPLEPEVTALGALKATVFKVRSSLGSDLIDTTPRGYALGTVGSDAEAFLRTGETTLWRGTYLEDIGLEGRDENVREALHRALEVRVGALLEGGATAAQEAARLGRLLVLAEPYDLIALDLACRALQASQNRQGLSRLYTEARTRLLEVGETLPERSAEFLRGSAAGKTVQNPSES